MIQSVYKTVNAIEENKVGWGQSEWSGVERREIPYYFATFYENSNVQ